jgi:hypothetical protein
VFTNTSKHLSSTNSGHIELILILGILEFLSKYSNNSANLDSQILFVESSPQADKLIQVKTTSFQPFFSKSKISSFDLEKCLHLFITVKQKVQKLSQPP